MGWQIWPLPHVAFTHFLQTPHKQFIIKITSESLLQPKAIHQAGWSSNLLYVYTSEPVQFLSPNFSWLLSDISMFFRV
jgi:hypothetical protein